MSRGDGGVVTKGCLVMKPSRRRSSVWSLDSLAGMFVEWILTNDPYKAY